MAIYLELGEHFLVPSVIILDQKYIVDQVLLPNLKLKQLKIFSSIMISAHVYLGILMVNLFYGHGDILLKK